MAKKTKVESVADKWTNEIINGSLEGITGETIKKLISAGADVDCRYQLDSRDESLWRVALHQAIDKQRIDILRALVEAGANINMYGGHKYTTLMSAAHVGAHVMVQILIDAGADVRVTDKSGYTALHYAAYARSSKSVEYLLRAGAEVNGVNVFGATPLLEVLCSSRVHADVNDCVRQLLQAGADTNVRDNNGLTAVDIARKYSNDDGCRILEAHIHSLTK